MFFSNRKTLWAWAGLALLSWPAGAQQLNVSLTLAYSVYVSGERVLVQCEVLNTMRDLIRVGEPGANDSAVVEITKGGLYNELAPFNTAPIVSAFNLKPGQSFQWKAELDKWFSLAEDGKYIARLVFIHDGIRYESAKRSFDVVPGFPVGEGVQMFVNRQNQKRLFKLVHWQRNQTERLFLKIEDQPDGKIWDSIDLGVLLRTSEPKIDISPEGEVTVLHRSTRDAFIRTVIWSLPENIEIVERNQLLDPEVSATQRMHALYGETAGDEEKKETKKSWWKFW